MCVCIARNKKYADKTDFKQQHFASKTRSVFLIQDVNMDAEDSPINDDSNGNMILFHFPEKTLTLLSTGPSAVVIGTVVSVAVIGTVAAGVLIWCCCVRKKCSRDHGVAGFDNTDGVKIHGLQTLGRSYQEPPAFADIRKASAKLKVGMTNTNCVRESFLQVFFFPSVNNSTIGLNLKTCWFVQTTVYARAPTFRCRLNNQVIRIPKKAVGVRKECP